MKNYYKHKSNKKFIAVEFNKFQFFETYENVGVHVKSDDKKFIEKIKKEPITDYKSMNQEQLVQSIFLL